PCSRRLPYCWTRNSTLRPNPLAADLGAAGLPRFSTGLDPGRRLCLRAEGRYIVPRYCILRDCAEAFQPRIRYVLQGIANNGMKGAFIAQVLGTEMAKKDDLFRLHKSGSINFPSPGPTQRLWLVNQLVQVFCDLRGETALRPVRRWEGSLCFYHF